MNDRTYPVPEGIPQASWDALLKLGLDPYRAYRAWQIITAAVEENRDH